MFRRFRQEDDSANSRPAAQPVQQQRPRSPIETVIGVGAAFKGTLKAPHGTRIDGTVEGSIQVSGPLVIGQNARIMADIWAGAVSVAGTVKGNIKAEKVDILSTGRIYGDLLTNAISTEEGGFLRGTVEMTDAAEELPAVSEPSASEPSGADAEG